MSSAFQPWVTELTWDEQVTLAMGLVGFAHDGVYRTTSLALVRWMRFVVLTEDATAIANGFAAKSHGEAATLLPSAVMTLALGALFSDAVRTIQALEVIASRHPGEPTRVLAESLCCAIKGAF